MGWPGWRRGWVTPSGTCIASWWPSWELGRGRWRGRSGGADGLGCLSRRRRCPSPTSRSRPGSPASGSSTTRSARCSRRLRPSCGRSSTATAASRRRGTITVRLPYRPPMDAEGLMGFLRSRRVTGIEEWDADTYKRALRLPHGTGTMALAVRDGYVECTLRLADLRDLSTAVWRARRLLDLDADPAAIDAALATDPALEPLVLKRPGIRVPGAVDGLEIAVRAVVGQQIGGGGGAYGSRPDRRGARRAAGRTRRRPDPRLPHRASTRGSAR